VEGTCNALHHGLDVVRGRDLQQRGALDVAAAGDVERHVKSPGFGDDTRDERGDGVFVEHVDRAVAGGAGRGGCGPQRVLGPPGEVDGGAFLDQAAGGGGADRPGAAPDDRGAVLQAVHGCLLEQLWRAPIPR